MKIRLVSVLVTGLLVASFMILSVAGASSSITSNFNGTAIPAGDTIWFSAVLNMAHAPSTPMSIDFFPSTITFTDPVNGLQYALTSVPEGKIVFQSGITVATTTWDAPNNRWVTTVPLGANDGNIFLTGVAYLVGSGQGESELHGGIHNVVWSGSFFSMPSGGFQVSWKWAAAVYTHFEPPSSLNVKPIDATSGSLFLNSHHAGTPENVLAYLTAGATGGGGSNFTGSYSGTASTTTEFGS